jgi:hypothetical protein
MIFKIFSPKKLAKKIGEKIGKKIWRKNWGCLLEQHYASFC